MYALGDLSEDCGVTMDCREVCDPFCVALVGTPGYTLEDCCSDQCSVPGTSTTFDAALVERPGGCAIMLQEIEAYSGDIPRGAGGILTEAESRALNAAVAAGILHVNMMGQPVDASGRRVDPYTLQVIPGQAIVPTPVAATPPPAGTQTTPAPPKAPSAGAAPIPTPGQGIPSTPSGILEILTSKYYGIPTWAYLAGVVLVIPRLLQRGSV